MPQYNDLPQGGQVVSAPQQAAPAQQTQPQQGGQYNDLPQGGQVQPQGQGKPNNVQPDDYLTKTENLIGKGEDLLGSVAAGFGKGAESTAHGISSLTHVDALGRAADLDKGAAYLMGGKGAVQQLSNITPQAGRTAMDNQSKPQGIGQGIGYGGEALTEFLLGDEALKGMSLADRLLTAHKITDALQSSPKVMKALQLGANIGKAASELGPEERELLQKYPTIARLVSLGMDSLRGGATQAAQTAVKTGGDVKQAAEQGAGVTAGGVALGAPLAAVGGALAKGVQTGNELTDLAKEGANAPEPSEGVSHVRNLLNNAETKMHTDYEAGINDLKHELGGNELPVKDSPVSNKAKEILNQASSTAKNEHPLVGQVKNSAGNKLDADTRSLLKNLASGESPKVSAPDTTKLVPLSETPQKTILSLKSGDNPIALGQVSLTPMDEKLGPGSMEVSTSQIKPSFQGKGYGGQLYRKLINYAKDSGVSTLYSDDQVSDQAKNVWESLKKDFPVEQVTAPDGSSRYKIDLSQVKEPEGTEMKPFNVGDLVSFRQEVRKLASNYQLGDPNSRALRQLLGSVDDSIDSMANQSPSDAGAKYKDLRTAYRTRLADLESTPLSKLRTNEPGQSVNDVGQYLLSGNTSKDKIETLARVIGPDQMKNVADNISKGWLKDATDESGKFNAQKFLNSYNKVKPEVRDTLFGQSLSGNNARINLDNFVDGAQTARNVQAAMKAGLLTVAGGAIHGPVGAAIGLLAGSGDTAASMKYGRSLLDYVVNHPATWASIRGGEKVATAGAEQAPRIVKGVGTTANLPATLKHVYAGSQKSLSQ